MTNLYIFDLDGTLLDTIEDLAGAVNFALKNNGLPTRTLAEVTSFVGNGMKTLIERSVPTGYENTEAVFQDFRTHYAAHNMDKTKPYDGIMEMLKRLKADGKKVAVVSNKADAPVQVLCQKYFDGLYDFAVGEQAGIAKKPAPDLVNLALEKLGETCDNAVYIGDSDVDIITANNAKMPCISVSWGFRSTEFLLAHGATRIVDSPNEIL